MLIKILGTNVLWWDLRDGPIPVSDKYFSTMSYSEGDCNYFRYKVLSMITFTGRMGEGERVDVPLINKEWEYPSPGTTDAEILKSICNYIK